MDEVLSGLILVVLATAIVYFLDYLASRSNRLRGSRLVLAILAIVLTVVPGFGALLAWLVSSREVGALSIGVLSAGLVLLAVLSARGRRAISRVLPLDPDTMRDWVGLIVILWLVILRLATFSGESDGEFGEISASAAVIQTFTLVGVAVASVGLLVRRNWRESLQRLGLDRLTPTAVSVGVVAVIPVAVMGALTVVLVEYIAPGTTDRLDETISEITGGQTSLGYGLLLGITAAAGEETLFRGALQPKYGLIFTSLAFALLHAQYDLLLIVASLFPVGLIFGLERRYLGTYASILTHALYNTLAVALG